MNLIVCAQDCRHQNDGYCVLNQITSLSSVSSEAKCGYYQKLAVPSTKNAPRDGMPSTEKMEGFR